MLCMAAECCSSCEYQRTVGYPSTSWASCPVWGLLSLGSCPRELLPGGSYPWGYCPEGIFVIQESPAPAVLRDFDTETFDGPTPCTVSTHNRPDTGCVQCAV